MTWLTQSPGFVRSKDGRFDLVQRADGTWVAYDWDRGEREERTTLDDAKDWCDEQTQTQAQGKERVA